MGKILGMATVRKKSQITIPKLAINYLNLKEGDNISITEENGKIILKRVKEVHEDFNIKS